MLRATSRCPAEEDRLDELCASADATLFRDQVSEPLRATQTGVLHAIVHAGNAAANDSAGQPRTGARLVSATNRPLTPMLLGGQFKRELYDRLSVLTLSVPPLRERRADIVMLAEDFLRAAAPQLRFSSGALKALAHYSFPGNVRELHNLSRASRSCSGTRRTSLSTRPTSARNWRALGLGRRYGSRPPSGCGGRCRCRR